MSLLTLLCSTLAAVATVPQDDAIPLYPGAAPGSETWKQVEVAYATPSGEKMIRNVVHPTLTAYLPDKSKAVGTAVIVCPGGGFRFHSWQNEGTAVAEWLRDRGIAAFVLKYRLVDTGATEAEFQKALAILFGAIDRTTMGGKPGDGIDIGNIIALASEDGRQAVRVVRRRAAEWGVLPDRIGILGFSAGGIITTNTALVHDSESRPNFAAPIYGAPFDAVTVPADAMPLFLLAAGDDAIAAKSCARLHAAWKEAGKSSELHVYSKGGHGFGMRKQGLPIDRWIERFGDWLEAQGLMKAISAQR